MTRILKIGDMHGLKPAPAGRCAVPFARNGATCTGAACIGTACTGTACTGTTCIGTARTGARDNGPPRDTGPRKRGAFFAGGAPRRFASLARSVAAALAGWVAFAPAFAGEVTPYPPMKPFEAFAGKVLRGEGTGPDGKPIVDIAEWSFILGGRALQSTHRLENGTYGGRTIFFFDEGSEDYVFHYFTTAGFHTTGTIELTEGGFSAVEKVIGHETFAEVRSVMTLDGDTATVSSVHVTKDGKTSQGDGMVYRVIDGPPPRFDDLMADDAAGKATTTEGTTP